MIDPAAFKVLTFDCYGTLIDWERGMLEVLRPWGARHGVGEEEILGLHARFETKVQSAQPRAAYRDVLPVVFQHMCEALGVPHEVEVGRRLGDSVGEWPAFADTPEAMRRLQSRYRLVVVSNVDRRSFEGSHARLGVTLDGLVTAQDVGAYKPDQRMLDAALALAATWGVGAGEVLHVAESLYHDHVPAKARGLTTAWIDRRSGRPGGATPPAGAAVTPDLRVTTLAQLADALGV